MGAFELIDALRTLQPRVRIIAMTGYVDPDVHAGVRGAGVGQILQKPFAADELLAAVDHALNAQDV
jgi:CheY-like chemotaxis protein